MLRPRLLSDLGREQVLGRLEGELEDPVRLFLFTRPASALVMPGEKPNAAAEELYEAERLVRELTAATSKIRVEVHDVRAEPKAAAHLGVEEVPTLVVSGRGETGVRFVGAPSGNLFHELLESIRRASTGDVGLPPESVEVLCHLPANVHLRLFATPTCGRPAPQCAPAFPRSDWE